MSKSRFANLFLVFAVVASAALIGTAKAAVPPPRGCLWTWTGRAFGWGLDTDNCDGHCSVPVRQGRYVGDLASTPCTACE